MYEWARDKYVLSKRLCVRFRDKKEKHGINLASIRLSMKNYADATLILY